MLRWRARTQNFLQSQREDWSKLVFFRAWPTPSSVPSPEAISPATSTAEATAGMEAEILIPTQLTQILLFQIKIWRWRWVTLYFQGFMVNYDQYLLCLIWVSGFMVLSLSLVVFFLKVFVWERDDWLVNNLCFFFISSVSSVWVYPFYFLLINGCLMAIYIYIYISCLALFIL